MRLEVVSEPQWIYAAEDMIADFGSPPGDIELTVRQVSGAVGPGDAATGLFALA